MGEKTRENRIAGLSFAEEKREESNSDYIFTMLLSLALYSSFSGVFLAMLGFNDLPWAALAVGAAVSLGEHFTPGGKPKWIVNCILAAVLVIAAIIWHSEVLDGGKLILNQVFSASEKSQKYIYSKFSVSADAGEYSLCITAAMIYIFTIFAVLCHFAVRQKNGSLLGIAFLMAVVAEIYYGIFPQLWTLILFAFVGLGVLHYRHIGKPAASNAALLVIALALSFAVLAAYTGPNAQQTVLAEDIRDLLDEHVQQQVFNAIKQRQEQIQEETENTSLEEDKVSDNTDGISGGNSFKTNYEKHFEGNKAGLAHTRLPWSWILIGVMLLALFTGYFMRMRKARRRRKVFESSDCAAAIDGMFRHSVDWLKVCGLKTDNRLFSQYSRRISKMLSEEYGRKYSGAAELWEEAIYSGHAMSEKERGCMREFLDDTAQAVRGHVGAFTRFEIKYRYFL